MPARFNLSAYVGTALAEAEYDKLADGTHVGYIPDCPGVLAFAETLKGCQEKLRSTLADWVRLGLKLGHRLPVLGGIDLNKKVVHANDRTSRCFMRTIEEILSAAASLSPADLGKLRAAIERMDRLAKALVLKTSGQMTFRLYRQTDSEHRESLRQSLAIDQGNRIFESLKKA